MTPGAAAASSGRLTAPGSRARSSATNDPAPGPVRTCVGCRATGPRQALLRVVVDPGANVLVVDVARRMPGRGAWLHPDPHCLELAVKRRAFGRALRLAASPDAGAVARYLEEQAEPHAAGTVPAAADRR